MVKANFTNKNKRRILKGVIFMIALFAIVQFIYIPKYKETIRLRGEYREMRSAIDSIYNFAGGTTDLNENIVKMRESADKLEKALPSEKDAANIIKELNAQARRYKITVISVKPGNADACKDGNGSEIRIRGGICKKIPFYLNVEGRYQAIGDFLKALESNKSPLVLATGVYMQKAQDAAQAIKAEIRLDAYAIED